MEIGRQKDRHTDRCTVSVYHVRADWVFCCCRCLFVCLFVCYVGVLIASSSVMVPW